MSEWIDVAPPGTFEDTPLQTVDFEGTSIAIVRIANDFHAVGNVCTHDYELMEENDLEGDELVCPRHGARFCVRTGEVKAPPAFEDLPTFPVKVENDLVKVCVDSLM